MDVEEFFTSFVDKLEGYVKGGKHENFIKNTFGGRLVTEMIGKGSCTHKSEREEPMITLQIEVKNKKNILESLEAFTEGELLEKDNAYQCDHCDAKVTALRRVCIKTLPNTLIIALRRFEFNFDTMQRIKLNDYCEFPMEIDMEPYTQEGIELRERQNEDTFGQEIQKKFPDEYYKYKLKGVNIHMGTANSGHYYSLITDREGEPDVWFEFNDSIVRPFKLEDMPSEAFGGTENYSFSIATTGTTTTNQREKYRNAYLLFYEREVFYDVSKTEIQTLEPLIPPLISMDSTQAVSDIITRVREENDKYWRSKNTFSTEYYKFLQNLWTKNQFNPELKFELFKFICSFYLTIMARSKDRINGIELILNLRDSIDEQCSEWLIEVFCVKMVHRELLLDCPINDVRKFILVLLKKAIETAGEEFRQKLLRSLLKDLDMCQKKYSRYFSQFLQVIYYLIENLGSATLSIPDFDLFDLLSNHYFSLDNTFAEISDPVFKHSDIFLGYDSEAAQSDVKEEAKGFFWDTSQNQTYLVEAMCLTLDPENPKHIALFNDTDRIDKLILDSTQKIGHKAVSSLLRKVGA